MSIPTTNPPSDITQNRRGRPFISHEIIINLIANIKTKNGLKIRVELDTRYQAGKKISDEESERVKPENSSFHGDWNDSISPDI
ncbi:MAG: hypothetical protein LBQ54_09320 [Planctomycetaceae bacterium]|jgi:hypothetical protein|nr:hypothetical protein [Planctomycetaceae bacterium]